MAKVLSSVKDMRFKSWYRGGRSYYGESPLKSPRDSDSDNELSNGYVSHGRLDEPLDLSDETLRQMAADLGADSLKFLTVDRLTKAIGMEESQLCTACVTQNYPTAAGTRNYQRQL